MLLFSRLARHGDLAHFTTTRAGGVSKGEYESLNLSFKVGDEEKCVLENRRRLAETVGVSPADFVFGEQVHGDGIAIVTEEMRGRGAYSWEDGLPRTDAMITNVPSVVLSVLVADCVPIVLYDPVERVCGAAHAGRPGSLLGITGKTVRMLGEKFGCNPKNIEAGIGPSIGPESYDLEDQFLGGVPDKYLHERGGKRFLDLWAMNKDQLIAAGIPERNIELSGIDTFRDERFFSHRRATGKGGRFGVGVVLRWGLLQQACYLRSAPRAKYCFISDW